MTRLFTIPRTAALRQRLAAAAGTLLLPVLCLALLTVLAGCRDDLDVAPGAGADSGDEGGVRYVAFRIRSVDASATRATADNGNSTDGNDDGDDSDGGSDNGSSGNGDNGGSDNDTPSADEDNPRFEKGDINEYGRASNPQAHRAFFFSDAGSYFGCTTLQSIEDLENSGHDTGHDGDYTKEEDIFFALLTDYDQKILEKGEPTQVLIVLNCDPAKLNQLDKYLETMPLGGVSTASPSSTPLQRALQWLPLYSGYDGGLRSIATYFEDGTYYLTMSNSTYIPQDGGVQTAARFSQDCYPTAFEAKQHPTVVYVERVAAKVEVLYKKTDGTDTDISSKDLKIFPPTEGTDGEGNEIPGTLPVEMNFDPDKYFETSPEYKQWYVTVENWGVNALEEHTFLFKNLVKADAKLNSTQQVPYLHFTAPTFGFNNNWTWTDPAYHRTYWAVDPHYDAIGYDFAPDTKHYYPDQYRPAPIADLTQKVIKPAGKFSDDSYSKVVTKDDELALKYVSYQDIINGNEALRPYSLENTYAYEKGLKGYAPLWYGTHILLAAKLHIEGVNATQQDCSNTTAQVPTDSDSGSDTEDLNPNADLYYAYGTFWKYSDEYIMYAYAKLRGSFYALYHQATDIPLLRDWKTGDLIDVTKGDLVKKYQDWEPAEQELYRKKTTEDEEPTSRDGKQLYVKIKIDEAPKFFSLAHAYVRHGDGQLIMEPKTGSGLPEIYVRKAPTPSDNNPDQSDPDKQIVNDNPTDENTPKSDNKDDELTEDEVALFYTPDQRNDEHADAYHFLKSMIYSFTSPVDHFSEGRMYYAIPIKHNDTRVTLSSYEDPEDSAQDDSHGAGTAADENGNIPGQYNLGNFGVVRNHWYKVTVNSISNVGTSVSDPDQPIVPNTPEEEKNIAVEVKILPWRVVENGDIWL